ncbi:protein of unknown function DUF1223 [Parvibaculum lavamentivorans DS-1]|uniref:DUF1223 domain-containing protein n=1 Tax=Parvibaculum lavamentivorans (strain DS-1 / DSM 13023 / NCIMB 13966) TaxID=402881 RepID=A7HSY8_PARL1|nr:DUF1223 domain-containing protein [Parvibaculum lavamentivorans]ABS63021.1 protein of unknown function DUF1223 [Parvibaculum lavamentivorans DS-1]
MRVRRIEFSTKVLIAGLLIAVAAATSSAVCAATRPVVVELFTSQGCSSCPKADAYLRELATRENVIALSFNVDYWDYLGWKDTLASPAFTRRQRAYAHRLGLSGVYTPQIVVNGVAEDVGSHRDEIEAAIAGQASGDAGVGMAFVEEDGSLMLNVESGDAPEKPATLWLVRYAAEEAVNIRRGENRSRTITYAHAVRELTPVGMWDGNALSLKLPKSDLLTKGLEGCVALLQAGEGGPILGAARIDLLQ